MNNTFVVVGVSVAIVILVADANEAFIDDRCGQQYARDRDRDQRGQPAHACGQTLDIEHIGSL